jgi:hypothetical protein
MDQILTVNEIRAAYPDQWVLVGNPQIAIASLTAGIVIANAKEKRDLVELSVGWREKYLLAMTFFTGERPKRRRILLNM